MLEQTKRAKQEKYDKEKSEKEDLVKLSDFFNETSRGGLNSFAGRN